MLQINKARKLATLQRSVLNFLKKWLENPFTSRDECEEVAQLHSFFLVENCLSAVLFEHLEHFIMLDG